MVLGERDVKVDVRAKNKRDGKRSNTVLCTQQDEGETLLIQGELELKMGSAQKVGLSRAVLSLVK